MNSFFCARKIVVNSSILQGIKTIVLIKGTKAVLIKHRNERNMQTGKNAHCVCYMFDLENYNGVYRDRYHPLII